MKTLQLSQGWRFTAAAISLSSLIQRIFDQNQNGVASVPRFLEGVVAELTQLVQDVELRPLPSFPYLFKKTCWKDFCVPQSETQTRARAHRSCLAQQTPPALHAET